MRCAFTLIELALVLVIVATVATLVVPLVGGFEIDGRSKEAVVTETTMRRIRDAVMGTSTKPGAWPDLGHRPDLFPLDPNLLLHDLGAIQQIEPSISAFDPVTKLGWRGPYLTGRNNLVDGWGNPFQIQVGDVNENGRLDEEDIRYARLVSAGPNGTFETHVGDGCIPGDESTPLGLTLAECGDDIVLFFRVADTRE